MLGAPLWPLLLLLTLCSCSRAHAGAGAHSAAAHEGCGQHHPLVAQQQAVLKRRLQQLRSTTTTAAAAAAGVYAYSDSRNSSNGAGQAKAPASAAAADGRRKPSPTSNSKQQASQQQKQQQLPGSSARGRPLPPGAGPLKPGKLRIGPVFQLEGLSPGDTQRVQQQLVPAAIKVLQKYIKVLRPEGGVLRVDAFFGDGQQGCLTSRVDASLATGNAGMRDTDLVLYVTSDDSTCTPGMVAIATACDVDTITQRPILGSLNMCGDALSGLNGLPRDSDEEAAAIGRVVEVLVHEIVHVLGFGSTHYDDWRAPGGKPYGEDNVIKYVDGRPYLASPKVTAVARSYFGCGSLPGAPLENEGPSFSAISHFEYRLLQRELMSPARPIDRSRSRLSAFTLAALEDTGWYVADYSTAEVLDWGRAAGCDFVTHSCWDYMVKNPGQPYYCGKGTLNQTRCTAEATGWGVCRSSAFGDGCLLVGKYSMNGAVAVPIWQQSSSEDGRQAACYSPPQLLAAAVRGSAGGSSNDGGSSPLLPLLGGSYSAKRSDICYNLVQPQVQPHSKVVWVNGRGQIPEDVRAPPPQQKPQQQQQQQRPLNSARVASQAAVACVSAAVAAPARPASSSGSSSRSSSSGGSSNPGRRLLSMFWAHPGPLASPGRQLTAAQSLAGPLAGTAAAAGTSTAHLASIERQLAAQSGTLLASSQRAAATCTSSPVLCFRSSCDGQGRLWVTVTPPGGKAVSFACPSRSMVDLSKQLPGRYLLGFLQCPSNALVCEAMGCAECSQAGGYCSRGSCYCHMERYGKACSQTLVPALK